MGMSLPHADWTVEMLNALPNDGNRYEVIDGELWVTPAPSLVHQRAQMQLAMLIAPHAEALGLDALTAPAAITFSQAREVQPDLIVLPRRTDGKRATRFADVGRLLLAVEILSPSTARVDRREKRVLYQQERVPEYWIVNVDARVFERWTPDNITPEICSQTISWRPLIAHDALEVDLRKYFRELSDE
ncbi:MAG: Uma2 family endonuclease [Gemmatimonas sp.]